MALLPGLALFCGLRMTITRLLACAWSLDYVALGAGKKHSRTLSKRYKTDENINKNIFFSVLSNYFKKEVGTYVCGCDFVEPLPNVEINEEKKNERV